MNYLLFIFRLFSVYEFLNSKPRVPFLKNNWNCGNNTEWGSKFVLPKHTVSTIIKELKEKSKNLTICTL